MRKGFTLVCVLILCMLMALPAVLADGGAIALRGWDAHEGYQYVQFGSYHQEYADQPILWRVLAVRNNRALLLSEFILDARPFDERTVEEGRTNEWEHSTLFQWMNGTFIDKAFTRAERRLILENGAVGRVFLPSNAELSNPNHGFESNKYDPDPARVAAGTPYAFDNGLWQQNSENSTYYTRTRPNNTNAQHFTTSGAVGLARVERTNVGMRPALWLNIRALPFTEGEGTMEDPFR